MSHFYQPDDDTWEGRMNSYMEEAEKQITSLRADNARLAQWADNAQERLAQSVKEVNALRAALDQERADNERLRAAAKVADWEQVRLNGGPPCFHIEDGRFCFRAERWPGHPTYHEFVTLHTALLWGRGDAKESPH